MTDRMGRSKRVVWAGRALALSSVAVFVVGISHPISALLIMIGLYGVYLMQSSKWLGVMGLILSAAGTLLSIVFGIAEIISNIVSFDQIAFTPSSVIGVGVLITMLGCILLGLATVRSSKLPRITGYLLMVTSVLVLAGMFEVIFGLLVHSGVSS